MAGLFSNIQRGFGNILDGISQFAHQRQGLNMFGRPRGTGFMMGQVPNSVSRRLASRLGGPPNAPNMPDEVYAIPTPEPPDLAQQFFDLTGGVQAGPNANLGMLAGTSGNLDPTNPEIAGSIRADLGLNPNYNVMNLLTNGRLDLTKLSPGVLARVPEQAAQRMINANVLGADLLAAALARPAATGSTRTRSAGRRK